MCALFVCRGELILTAIRVSPARRAACGILRGISPPPFIVPDWRQESGNSVLSHEILLSVNLIGFNHKIVVSECQYIRKQLGFCLYDSSCMAMLCFSIIKGFALGTQRY